MRNLFSGASLGAIVGIAVSFISILSASPLDNGTVGISRAFMSLFTDVGIGFLVRTTVISMVFCGILFFIGKVIQRIFYALLFRTISKRNAEAVEILQNIFETKA